ncbi:MAG: hypothetical protein JW803_02070 [Endomicrobiales bacterium]|nr:hypothetical protein [Endomicrobiales bacterium]
MEGKGRVGRILRLIDANLNRSREGLRVVEDTLRFVLEKKALYKKVRSLRHELDAVTRAIYPKLLSARDSRGDSGRLIKEAAARGNSRGVLAANFRRIEESLRVLEEYSRLAGPDAGKKFKSIRFKTYTLEKNLIAQK